MRRILMAILCCLLLVTAVSASSVTDLQSNTSVHANGTCEVTLTVQLQLDEIPESLNFPLPKNARDISLNGGLARTHLEGNVRNVDLGSIVHSPGIYTFTIHYSLPDSVTADEKENLLLSFDLLSGFSYPIEAMRFTVTLPGTPERRPEFVSTYHQESVDTLMDLQIEGTVITGTFLQGLKDLESLSMTLFVTEELFPQPIAKKWSLSTDDIAMYVCAAVALLYWLLTMRALPPRRLRRTNEPEGLTAGELGCCLCGQGVDFTMMVVSWAQMGYLLIQLDDHGRVLLHKRMEMGNERSEFENRMFHNLFGKKRTVDGTGYQYARLCRKAAGSVPGRRNWFLRHSGNPKILRAISALIGFFGGIALALAFASDTAWQIILSLFLTVLGIAVAWCIQSGAGRIHLRQKLELYIGLGCTALWLLLGLWGGEFGVALFVVAIQWLTGLAAAYGGRRNEPGRLAMAEILGLRRYLKSVSKDELKKILRFNPDYYYNLAPYAMALGVDKAFARQFGGTQLPGCTWLTTGMDGHMTAMEWNQLLREAVAALDERQQKLPYEKLLGK